MRLGWLLAVKRDFPALGPSRHVVLFHSPPRRRQLYRGGLKGWVGRAASLSCAVLASASSFKTRNARRCALVAISCLPKRCDLGGGASRRRQAMTLVAALFRRWSDWLLPFESFSACPADRKLKPRLLPQPTLTAGFSAFCGSPSSPVKLSHTGNASLLASSVAFQAGLGSRSRCARTSATD